MINDFVNVIMFSCLLFVQSVVLAEGPCYTATKVAIKAKNPYPSSAEFRIEVLQTGTEKQVSGAPNVNGVDTKKKSIKNFASRTGLANDATSKQPKAVKSQGLCNFCPHIYTI